MDGKDVSRWQQVSGLTKGQMSTSEKIQEVRNLIDELEVQQRSERKISESEVVSLRGENTICYPTESGGWSFTSATFGPSTKSKIVVEKTGNLYL